MAGKKQRARKIHVWISYDLGGDHKKYQQIYGWLKGYEAEECGNSTAHLIYSKGARRYLARSIANELTELFDDLDNVRIFIIYQGDKNVLKYRQLFGAAKDAPWADAEPIYV